MTKKYGQSTQNKAFQCKICEQYRSQSTVDIKKHIMNDHNLKERIDSLTERTMAEDCEGEV